MIEETTKTGRRGHEPDMAPSSKGAAMPTTDAPGLMPRTPHPTPKTTEPMSSMRSSCDPWMLPTSSLFGGREKVWERYGNGKGKVRERPGRGKGKVRNRYGKGMEKVWKR